MCESWWWGSRFGGREESIFIFGGAWDCCLLNWWEERGERAHAGGIFFGRSGCYSIHPFTRWMYCIVYMKWDGMEGNWNFIFWISIYFGGIELKREVYVKGGNNGWLRFVYCHYAWRSAKNHQNQILVLCGNCMCGFLHPPFGWFMIVFWGEEEKRKGGSCLRRNRKNIFRRSWWG